MKINNHNNNNGTAVIIIKKIIDITKVTRLTLPKMILLLYDPKIIIIIDIFARMMSTLDTSGAAEVQQGCPQHHWAKWLWIAAALGRR